MVGTHLGLPVQCGVSFASQSCGSELPEKHDGLHIARWDQMQWEILFIFAIVHLTYHILGYGKKKKSGLQYSMGIGSQSLYFRSVYTDMIILNIINIYSK